MKLIDQKTLLERVGQAIASSRQHGLTHSLCMAGVIEDSKENQFESRPVLNWDALVKILRREVRGRDSVANLDAHHFALLLENCRVAQAENVVNKVAVQIAAHMNQDDPDPGIRVCFGIVSIDQQSVSAIQALRQADLACTAAIQGSESGIFVVSHFPAVESATPTIGPGEWSTAIAHNRLSIVGQPIVDMSAPDPRRQETEAAAPTWYEVLLRIRNEKDQTISPRFVIPATEQHGLMVEVDRWVVTAALKAAANYRSKSPPVKLSINLSANSFADESLVDTVAALLDDYDVCANTICFELTETAAVDNFDRARRLADGLKNLGCAFALDDFGGGVSSLRYLHELPVDFLKIDSLFVKSMGTHAKQQTMIEAIQRLADTLNIVTVAEGIESADQAKRLAAMGVRFGQGFYFGVPQPLNAD